MVVNGGGKLLRTTGIPGDPCYSLDETQVLRCAANMFWAHEAFEFRQWLLRLEAHFVAKVQVNTVKEFCVKWGWKFERGTSCYFFQKLDDKQCVAVQEEDVVRAEGLHEDESFELRQALGVLGVSLVTGENHTVGMLCESYTPQF